MDKKTREKWFVNQLLDKIKKAGRKGLQLHLAPYALLIGIATFCDKKGECYPLQSQLEAVSMVEKSNMHKSLKVLKEKGYIKITRKYDRRHRMTRNYYKINLEAIVAINLDLKKPSKLSMLSTQKNSTVQILNQTSWGRLTKTSWGRMLYIKLPIKQNYPLLPLEILSKSAIWIYLTSSQNY